MKTYSQEELNNIIELNRLYTIGDPKGKKANLEGANLEGADLRGANLRGANLEGANLIEANLEGANLIEANLIGADLRGADLIGADLRRADLRRADLIWADLEEANLSYCIGNSREIKTIQTDTYHICYTKDVMAIGRKQYTIKEWFDFDDTTIGSMDKGKSLKWWLKNKETLRLITNGELL